jgi:hypothetical protein
MSVIEFVRTPYVFTALVLLGVFFEMFAAKKLYVGFTSTIKNEKARRGLNLFFGLVVCFILAYGQMYVFTNLISAEFALKHVAAAACGATLLYLALEKVFTDSEMTAIGKVFCDIISRSDLFDGEITAAGVRGTIANLLSIVQNKDADKAAKEQKAVDEVAARLDAFLADGKVTVEEKEAAKKMVESCNTPLSGSTRAKYEALLKM